MISIVVIGFGNVGSHLCQAFQNAEEVALVQIYNRSEISLPESLQAIAVTHSISGLAKADVYLLALPDDIISEFSSKLPKSDTLVVHTSGGVSMNSLNRDNHRGVFYPLQSFSKSRKPEFKKIPICIEAEHHSDLNLLQELGESISEKVVAISSEERGRLHLSAVFVNNFVNHMYHISETMLEEADLDFDLLKPLIRETAHKIESMSASNAQTGPALRGDTKTLEKHLHLLKDSPYKEIYEQLTSSIQETYGKKL
ncbi:MAG: DUF2520 domain-containing protein [Bacteroidia bacterium]|nr:DUF2520 domain-containing protein [Bacteroidia bacterium]NNF31347.1 DUF2520 domain-containing protein [Flavobacteriaceae bacterium]MBT8276577.1 DUF2520 domain-containing protein [Bacteroidia bacterium]NNJ81361.1 DUF2520 domain-containing protein [Flavobacteriaceae bacterium]NNK54379.1 DUF2520 domain-containing protein [Flavobacteriaceae bacterium]